MASHHYYNSNIDSLNSDQILNENKEQGDDAESFRDSLKRIYDIVENDDSPFFFCLNGTDGDYSNVLTIYDMNSHATKTVNICQFEEYIPDFMKIKDYAINHGTITFIISDDSRNGSGGHLCNTQVWKFDSGTETWQDLDPSGDGCAGAKFIDGKTKVKLTVGTILNEETASCEAEYDYDFTTKSIDL